MAEKMSKALIMGTEYDLTDADAQEKIGKLNGAISDVNAVLEYDPDINAQIEQYSINASTGKNTTSSYTKYYRTGGFYQPSHIKAASTRGTLRTAIFFYSAADVETFISATEYISGLDADVVYPAGAKYVRIAGYVDGNPDNPLDLSAVTVVMTMPPDKADSKIKTLETDVERIQAKLEPVDFDDVVISKTDTGVMYNIIPPDTTWTANKQIKPDDGTLQDYSGRYASGYIPIDNTNSYVLIYLAVIYKAYDPETETFIRTTIAPLNVYQYAFYDSSYTFVASASETSDYAKLIPSNAKYIRVTAEAEDRIKHAMMIYSSDAVSNVVTVGYAAYKTIPAKDYQMPLSGFEKSRIVCFGDSITHGDMTGNSDGISYVDYASRHLNTPMYNVGFGSTTAALVGDAPAGNGLFAFANLIDCVTSDDPAAWSDLDAWASSASGNETFALHLSRLKGINWDEINAVTILYGANDWAAGVPVGTDYNETVTNYDGAIAYGIKKLLTKYPHLQVLVFSPFFRRRTVSDVVNISDDPNSAGLTMPDYAASLKNVQKKLHVPVIDSGNWNVNDLTMDILSPDGTHPINNIGKERIGHLVAKAIQTNLSPV